MESVTRARSLSGGVMDSPSARYASRRASAAFTARQVGIHRPAELVDALCQPQLFTFVRSSQGSWQVTAVQTQKLPYISTLGFSIKTQNTATGHTRPF